MRSGPADAHFQHWIIEFASAVCCGLPQDKLGGKPCWPWRILLHNFTRKFNPGESSRAYHPPIMYSIGFWNRWQTSRARASIRENIHPGCLPGLRLRVL
jgi:hypothetical protein